MPEQVDVERLLLNKCRTAPSDKTVVQLIDDMADADLVCRSVEHYVLCDCPDDPDRHLHNGCSGRVYGKPDGSFPADEYRCNGELEHRVFPDRKRKFQEIVTEPNHEGIDAWLEGVATSAGFTPARREAGLFEVTHSGTVVTVCYVERCLNPTMLGLSLTFDDPIVYIYNVLPTLAPQWLDVSIATDVASLYVDADSFATKVEEAAAKPRSRSLADAAQAFDDFRKGLPSDAAFERFCRAFLQHLANSPAVVRNYIALLRRHQNDVHGRYHTTAGGAGHPDGYYWPKYEYLQAILEGRMNSGQIEAKCYELKSTVGNSDWFKLYGHAKDKPGILFATTNAVSGFVWENLFDVNKQSDWCRFVVIPRDLLIEMIVQCEAESLYDEEAISKPGHVLTLYNSAC
ncbi:MAG: hypothetical protein KKB50_00250 [Planctomycetes bacterium]|nr:hypothetical protein [Planctomycetota bacterium]